MDLNAILNIRNVDRSADIYKVVSYEKEKLNEQVSDYTGFCKYMASAIECDLQELGIRTYKIDLNDIGVDHVFLISEYRNNEMVRFLIDPTYSQFTKSDNKELVGMDFWPSDRLYPETLDALLEDGVVKINSDIFNNYLNSFGSDEVITSLDDYLLDLRMNNLERRR